jgi:hypothetical protein
MPYYRFELASSLQPQAILERISAQVTAPRSFAAEFERGFRFGRIPGPPFIGTVEADAFEITRDIRYRNSFLPRIKGRVRSVSTGSCIDVRMYIHPAVAIIMVVWLVGFGAAAMVSLHGLMRGGDEPLVLMPLVIFVVGILVVCVGFFPEAFKARRMLEQILARPPGVR